MTLSIGNDAQLPASTAGLPHPNGLLLRACAIDGHAHGRIATLDERLMASAQRLGLVVVGPEEVLLRFPGMASLGAWSQETHVYRLDPGHYVLGRADHCELVLDCNGISRRHAALEVLGDKGFVIRDLGSTNGTAVDGARARAVAMHEPAVIRLGPLSLLLVPDRVREPLPLAALAHP